MINTKEMMARDKTAPYVSPANALVGTCAPLKHFFCRHGFASAGATLTDAVSGVRLRDVTAPIALSGEMVLSNISANIDLDAGAWAVVGTKDVLLVAAGQAKSTTGNALHFAAGNLSIGAGFRLRNTNTGGTCQLRDGTTLVTLPALSALTLDTDYALFCGFDRDSATGGKPRRYAAPAAVAAQSSANADISTAQASTTPEAVATLSGQFHGVGMFVFTAGLPANWEAWSIWMCEQWRAGKYVFPPAWRNLT